MLGSRATTVSIYRMRLWCVILFGWLSLLLCVHCGYVPSYGDDYIVYFATAGGEQASKRAKPSLATLAIRACIRACNVYNNEGVDERM